MRLSRFTRAQISSKGTGPPGHIAGMGSRKEAALSPFKRGTKKFQLSQHTAPYKHQAARSPFGTNIAIEGPEEGLPP